MDNNLDKLIPFQIELQAVVKKGKRIHDNNSNKNNNHNRNDFFF